MRRRATPYPEIVAAARERTDDGAGGAGGWTVQTGRAARGDAWTNQSGREMRAPGDATEAGRVIRAHEQMHVAVSPPRWEPIIKHYGISHEALAAAEELRVNSVLHALGGFNVDALCDGSEKGSGASALEDGSPEAFAAIAVFTVACAIVGPRAGGKALTDLLAGVRYGREGQRKTWDVDAGKAWADVLRALADECAQEYRDAKFYGPAAAPDVLTLGTWNDDGTERVSTVTVGFHTHTVPVARVLQDLLDKVARRRGTPSEDGSLFGDTDDDEPDARETISQVLAPDVVGDWYPLIVDEDRPSVNATGTLKCASVKRHDIVGKRPDVSRALTDPNRAMTSRKRAGSGGVVLVDLSGSRSFTEHQIAHVIITCPGATILGYHSPRGASDVTAHVLAHRGKRVARLPLGKGGNGVDGPALTWALRFRRSPRDPVVWVTDGDVNGKRNGMSLAAECLAIVRRHGVRMVRTPEQACDALTARRWPMTLDGNVAAAAMHTNLTPGEDFRYASSL